MHHDEPELRGRSVEEILGTEAKAEKPPVAVPPAAPAVEAAVEAPAAAGPPPPAGA